MEKNIAIVHYNTPRLTECLVMSINKFVEDAKIYIFDNSDKLPFTAKFDNVSIFDNTKGQIINFEKWLNKYPNRANSIGAPANFVSAKHTYSVEKCMQLIDKPFVLMDSDILLKRDISDLYDDDCIFVGNVVNQIKSVKRILPYLCYINTTMCKENNVHYFNEQLMHGLRVTVKGDLFDTGASFLHDASDFKHREINIADYMVHYGHGSWNKYGHKPALSLQQWLEQYKILWARTDE